MKENFSSSLAGDITSTRGTTDANLPEWLIAFAPDGREFVIHLLHPRFFVEAKAAPFRKWKVNVGLFDSNGSKWADEESDDLLRRACEFYVSEIYGLSPRE